jgi:hypothetical protein
MLPAFLLEEGSAMEVGFRAAMAAVLAILLGGPALSQGDFLRSAAPILPEQPAARMPDLMVTHGKVVPEGGDQVIVGGKLIVGGGLERFTWSHRTKNVGNATPLKPSDTAVGFVGSPGGLPQGAHLDVPKLAPGKFIGGHRSFLVSVRKWKFGTYQTEICADSLHDVEESNNDNNCRNAKPIYVVPSRLRGKVSGRHKQILTGIEIVWDVDVTYDIAGVVPGNPNIATDYIASEVSVTYTVQGTVPGDDCRWSGGGTDTQRVQKIRLMFEPIHIFVPESTKSEDFTVRITLRCRGDKPTSARLPPPPWFITGGFWEVQSARFETVEGHDTLRTPGVERTEWVWNLAAE